MHTLWFYLHQTLENANEYIVAEKRVSGCLGMRHTASQGRGISKG